MPKKESIQQKISRVRPPRVHITYDVEVGGAIEMKELPFVLGVLGDFSGNPEEAPPRLRDRKFVEIDRDNFDDVLAGMKPRLVMKVDNTLQDDGSQLGVELKFRQMSDFEPDQLVKQVEPLRRLVELRQNLSDLLAKTDGNDKLGDLLQNVLQSTDDQKKLGQELGIDVSGEGDKPKEEK